MGQIAVRGALALRDVRPLSLLTLRPTSGTVRVAREYRPITLMVVSLPSACLGTVADRPIFLGARALADGAWQLVQSIACRRGASLFSLFAHPVPL